MKKGLLTIAIAGITAMQIYSQDLTGTKTLEKYTDERNIIKTAGVKICDILKLDESYGDTTLDRQLIYDQNGFLVSEHYTSGSYISEDSGYTNFFTYNEKGLLINKITSGMDEIPYSTNYFYNSSDALEEIEYSSADPCKYQINRDKDGLIIEKTGFNIPIYEDEESHALQKYLYYYDNQLNLDSLIYMYNPSGDEIFNDEALYYKIYYKYDAKGRLIKESTDYFAFQDMETMDYSYNEAGLIKEVINTKSDSSTIRYIYKCQYY